MPWLLVRKQTISNERPPWPPNLAPIFTDRLCFVVSAMDPFRPLISVFQIGDATFSFKQLLTYPQEAEWTGLQTHHFSENLVAPGIEPRTLGALTTRPQRRSIKLNSVHNHVD
jgi:hypothetical protein